MLVWSGDVKKTSNHAHYIHDERTSIEIAADPAHGERTAPECRWTCVPRDSQALADVAEDPQWPGPHPVPDYTHPHASRAVVNQDRAPVSFAFAHSRTSSSTPFMQQKLEQSTVSREHAVAITGSFEEVWIGIRGQAGHGRPPACSGSEGWGGTGLAGLASVSSASGGFRSSAPSGRLYRAGLPPILHRALAAKSGSGTE